MILRWILFAVVFLLARRLVLSLLGRGRRDGGRAGARRPRDRSGADAGADRERDLAAGQRIEEAEYEELD